MARLLLKTLCISIKFGKETNGPVRSMNLKNVRTHTLRPLRIKVRKKKQDKDGEPASYEMLKPSLRVDLSNNSLNEFPSELYLMGNLTVLSLRGNNITEILPSIMSLVNLRELDLADNQLNYLPYELMCLNSFGKLENCKHSFYTIFSPLSSLLATQVIHPSSLL